MSGFNQFLRVQKEMTRCQERYADFNKRSAAASSTIVNEFLRKKRAFEIANARNKDSGELDTKKLHEVRVNANIFQKKKYFEKGKNHAFYILLDWSGSFKDSFKQSVHQTIVMADFARSLRERFVVTALKHNRLCNRKAVLAKDEQTQDGAGFDKQSDPRSLCLNGEYLIDIILLSSDMDDEEYHNHRWLLWFIAEELTADWQDRMTITMIRNEASAENMGVSAENRAYSVSHKFNRDSVDFLNMLRTDLSLGGTPLNEALIATRQRMFAERSPNLIQNLILMTDGAGGALVARADGVTLRNWSLQDPVTKKIYTAQQEFFDKLRLGDYSQEEKMSMYEEGFACVQSHFILETMDWPNVNKFWFFIEPKRAESKIGAYKSIFPSSKDMNYGGKMLQLRKDLGTDAPMIVKNYGAVDQFIAVDSNMFNDGSQNQTHRKVSVKHMAKQFANENKKEATMQLIARKMADIMSVAYARNRDFLKKDGCHYVDFAECFEKIRW